MSATVFDGSQERNGQPVNGTEHVTIWVGDSHEDATLRQASDDGPVASTLVSNGEEGTEPSIERNGQPVNDTEHVAISVGDSHEDASLRQASDDCPVVSTLVETGFEEEKQQLQKVYTGPVSKGEEGKGPSIEAKSSSSDEEASDPAFAQELQGREAIEFLYDMGLIQVDTGILNESEKTRLRQELYDAARAGDLVSASSIFESFPFEREAEITNRGETVLHIAATAGHYDFVRYLIDLISVEALTHRDIAGNTAFLCATSSGHVEIAMLMLERNKDLAKLRGAGGSLPIHLAADAGKIEMVRNLYRVTRDDLTEDDRTNLFLALIDAGIYDFALKMLEDYPGLAQATDRSEKTGLDAILRQLCNDQTLLLEGSGSNRAQRKSHNHAYAQELLRRIWRSQTTYLYGLENEVQRSPTMLLTMLNKCFPDMILISDEMGRNIFHVAVHHRHGDIFNLINEMSFSKMQITTSVDHKKNNLLHFAAMKPPEHRLNVVAGAALQLQRELLWFEAVKKVVPKELASKENAEGKTPENVLMEDHHKLMTAGEKWMKNTANSCMLVATLIATVVFAAAFTLPGGNNQETGIPIFLGKTSFKIFAVFDAVALILSVSSILIFLSIFSSTYSLGDFRRSLPKKLILGLGTLLFSIVAMLIAFVAAFYIICEHGLQTYATLVAAISPIPVLLFVWLHGSLFLGVFKSTYASTSLFKANNTPTAAEAEFHVGIKID